MFIIFYVFKYNLLKFMENNSNDNSRAIFGLDSEDLTQDSQINHLDNGFVLEDEGSFIITRVASDEIIYNSNPKRSKIIANRYLVGEILGEGSYGKVKECLNIYSLERLAVKILYKKRLKKIPNGETNVRREISTLKRLKHPNLINLLDTYENEEKQKIYMFLDYCVIGLQELLDSTSKKCFPIFQAHNYFSQLIYGLEYLHSRGVIHKDIKPGNLLLTNDEILKITDLGVAEVLNQFSFTDICQSSQGSPAFQPPEVANGDEIIYGHKVDIWSSGVTLYNITTGLYPFEGENIYKLYENISKGEYSIPNVVDTQLSNLLTNLLESKPQSRYSIKDIKNHAWFQRKHPRILTEKVHVAARRNNLDDPWRSFTIIDGLFDMHERESVDEITINGNFKNTEQANCQNNIEGSYLESDINHKAKQTSKFNRFKSCFCAQS